MRVRFPAALEVFFFTTVPFVAVGRILSLLADELEVNSSGKVAGGVKLTANLHVYQDKNARSYASSPKYNLPGVG
jgi:hypothetical protein